MSKDARMLTDKEFDALLDAIALQDVVWEQDGDENGIDSVSSRAKRRALTRAQRKIQSQLVKEETK